MSPTFVIDDPAATTGLRTVGRVYEAAITTRDVRDAVDVALGPSGCPAGAAVAGKQGGRGDSRDGEYAQRGKSDHEMFHFRLQNNKC